MNEREWRPGDVAMVSIDGRELMCTFYDTRSERGWFHGLGFTSNHYVAQEHHVDARPLAVIDLKPNEADFVIDALERVGHSWTRKVADALRVIASPPKPDEPTGLGAVVEDDEKRLWIRSSDTDCRKPWIRANSFDESEYADIDAVRVLSEGVAA